MFCIPMQVYVTNDHWPLVKLYALHVYDGALAPLEIYPRMHVKEVVEPKVTFGVGWFAFVSVGAVEFWQ